MNEKITRAVWIFCLSTLALSQVTARRINIEIKDSSQQPLGNVQITLSSPERSDFHKVYETNKKGQAAFLLPFEIKNVSVALDKEGYQSRQELVELAKARKSQEELHYNLDFILYRIDEQSPEQMAKNAASLQETLGFFERGIGLFNAGDFKGAIAEFEKAVDVKPDFLEGWQNLAAAHYRAEEYEKAIEAGSKALDLDPRAVQMIRLVSASYSKLGDEKTAEEFQERLKNLPEANLSAEEFYNLAVVAANGNRDAEAVEYFEKALSLKPGFGPAHYHLGLCHFRLNNLEKAEKELEAYLGLEPEGEFAKTARALLEQIRKIKA
jgi:tetratricopeptide (TPR) repeat protein